MKTPVSSICLAAFLVVMGSLTGRGSVLFDNTTWYASGTSTSLAVNSGTMALAVGSGAFALTYLTPSGSYNSISIGETITLTINFSIPGTIGASATGLRFGLLNSGGSRISTDGIGQSSTTYTNYAGYVATFGSNSLSNSSLTSALWERGSNNALINSSAAYTTGTSASSSTSSTPALTADTNYTLSLSLNLVSASDLKVTSILTGGVLPGGGIIRSYDDLTSPTTSFDTVVLFSTSSMASNLNIQSVAVAVPEPSTRHTVMVVFGATLFGLYASHRRRRLREPRL